MEFFTGLGSLYVIMRAHGGTMEIRSKEGDGCRIIPDIAYRVLL